VAPARRTLCFTGTLCTFIASRPWLQSPIRTPEASGGHGPMTVVTVLSRALLEALLWALHNARSCLCFPSYQKIAEAAARPSQRPSRRWRTRGPLMGPADQACEDALPRSVRRRPGACGAAKDIERLQLQRPQRRQLRRIEFRVGIRCVVLVELRIGER
jgi:hypothetical protein